MKCGWICYFKYEYNSVYYTNTNEKYVIQSGLVEKFTSKNITDFNSKL